MMIEVETLAKAFRAAADANQPASMRALRAYLSESTISSTQNMIVRRDPQVEATQTAVYNTLSAIASVFESLAGDASSV